jgi:hypothetical protein
MTFFIKKATQWHTDRKWALFYNHLDTMVLYDWYDTYDKAKDALKAYNVRTLTYSDNAFADWNIKNGKYWLEEWEMGWKE